MRTAVTGSIATDYLMTFPGHFTDSIVPEQLDRLSVSFLVDELKIYFGGCAANICFGMGQLGTQPVLVGAVGEDFKGDYEPWLRKHGVDTESVYVSSEHHTPRFMCTTDAQERQIASFYAGAMQEARELALQPVIDRLGGLDLVVVSPNDPEAMLRHTREARELGVPFVADPSQQLARLEGGQIRELVDGAAYLFCNDYERALSESKTGWSSEEILGRVGIRVTTYGAEGCVIEQADQPPIAVPAVAAASGRIWDPTGVGDAFRGGFLSGLDWGLAVERSAQLGSGVATISLETPGAQEYEIDVAVLQRRLAGAYGQEASADVASAGGLAPLSRSNGDAAS